MQDCVEPLAEVQQLLGQAVARPAFALSDPQLTGRLHNLQLIIAMVEAARLQTIAELEGRGLPAAQGAANTTAWLREQLRISAPQAGRLRRLAQTLSTPLLADTANQLAGGQINVEQVQVIATAVADLPAAAQRAGQAFMLEQAAKFGPPELSRLGERLLEVIDPHAAEAEEHSALHRHEQRSYLARELYLTPIDPGRVRITGWLDRESAAIIHTALEPLCRPSHRSDEPKAAPQSERQSGVGAPTGQPTPPGLPTAGREPGDLRSLAQRRADALVEICQLATSTGQLPAHGGDRPQVVVTIDLEALRSEFGVASLDDGSHLSASAARRIACDAGLIPAVLGGKGQVLDLGRERRLISGPLRRALILRDGGCAFPTCDRPPRWCQAHHIKPWIDGGPTTLANSALLCHRHHRLIHDGQWGVRLNPSHGRPEFSPPTWIDPHRTPLHNHYHRRE